MKPSCIGDFHELSGQQEIRIGVIPCGLLLKEERCYGRLPSNDGKISAISQKKNPDIGKKCQRPDGRTDIRLVTHIQRDIGHAQHHKQNGQTI